MKRGGKKRKGFPSMYFGDPKKVANMDPKKLLAMKKSHDNLKFSEDYPDTQL